MKPIIEITNLSKKYPIIHDKTPYRTFRETIMHRLRHPFARNKTQETFWALKDINLTINRGEIIGVIGKNGAGKSTLLKILSGITKPSEGKIKLYGRVSSLLEVGTGFHPELTGRENIFLNGVILGMTRKEVEKKFNEIVAFAGVEQFLDTPVKHYSSGMYVRLAFAIAAHLEPDILIIDEVLAVGDIEFQKKCLGKMEEVSKEEGRTVIFVSHNMGIIQKLCSKTILINNGKISAQGNTREVIEKYLSKSQQIDSLQKDKKSKVSYISKVEILDEQNNKVNFINKDNEFHLFFEIIANKNIPSLRFGFTIFNTDNVGMFSSLSTDSDIKFKEGVTQFKVRLPGELLHSGQYRIEGALGADGIMFEQNENYISFECIRYSNYEPKTFKGLLRLPYKWKTM
jgi:lipopolysaccharide transport system ATP-binding protein